MDRSAQLSWLYDRLVEIDSAGVVRRTLEDERLDGRHVRLDGQPMLNFGSCSYLGLELDERLKLGAIEAIERFGTQVSSSRSFMSAPPYADLEHLLSEIFGGYAVATPTTTLGHLAALPVLVGARDVVLIDQYAHASLHMACSVLSSGGTRVELVRHSDLAVLEERIQAVAPACNRIWYIADGVYSMRGDIAPIGPIHALLARYPQLHFYADDAHGVSWKGKHGRGAMLERHPLHARMVLAASLAKSFGSGGGAIIVPDATLADRIRTVGPTMMFSGPIQPATLGASVASARIHLSEDLVALQAALKERILYCNRLIEERGLPLASMHNSPVRYVPCGPARVGLALAVRLKADGLFINPVHAPAVPMRRAGIRFTLTVHHQMEDIDRIVDSLDRHYEAAFADCGDDPCEVFDEFRMVPTERIQALRNSQTKGLSRGLGGAVDVSCETSIAQVPREDWDACFGGRGAFDAAAMGFAESCFGSASPERADRGEGNDWKFRYVTARSATSGTPTAAAPFTFALWKADMLAPREVSVAVEARREVDPGYLTLKTLGMGSALSEGNHLYLDRAADWRAGLASLLESVRAEARELNADAIVLRDLPCDDAELDAALRDEDFVAEAMPEVYSVDLRAWTDESAWIARLRSKARYAYRSEVSAFDDVYRCEIVGKGTRLLTEAEHETAYEMYRNVKRRNLELNTFDLPPDFFRRVEADPSWELVLLYADGGLGADASDGELVSVGACYANARVYVPTVLGMDDRYIQKSGLYRQSIRHAILRGAELGCERVELGFGNGLVKKRFGAEATQRRMYIQVIDSFAIAALAQLRANLGA